MTNASKKVVSAKSTAVKGNVETIVNQAPAVAPVVVAAAAPVVVTKADKAREIFAKAYPDGKTTTMQRKDIINLLVSDAGLTKAGAGTYLQNMKSKAGIVQKRVAAAPAAVVDTAPAA